MYWVRTSLQILCGTLIAIVCLVLLYLVGQAIYPIPTPIGTVTVFTFDVNGVPYRCAVVLTEIGPQVLYMSPITVGYVPQELKPFGVNETVYAENRNALHFFSPHWNTESDREFTEADFLATGRTNLGPT